MEIFTVHRYQLMEEHGVVILRWRGGYLPCVHDVSFNVLDLQARLITAANYKDTVEERSIVKLCGYPVCSNKLGKVRFCVFLKGFTFLTCLPVHDWSKLTYSGICLIFFY